MSWYLLATILSYSILPAAIIALIKYRQCRGTYLPFLCLLLVSLINEVISTVVISQGMRNSVNNNIYVLVEVWLLLWLFQRWEPSAGRTRYYLITATVLTGVWIADNLILHSIDSFTSLYRIAYSLLIVFLTADQLSYIIVNESSILTNTRFILCVTFLIRYCYKAFIEMLVAVDAGFSNSFYEWFFVIWLTINFLANLSYVVAAIWIPRKERYYITYS